MFFFSPFFFAVFEFFILLLLSPSPCARLDSYGQTGPDTLRAGHDVNYLARAGVLGMSASPALLPVQVADLACGAWPAAMQIVTALYARQKSNRGSVIDVSMTDGAYSLLVMPLARHALAEDGKAEPISQGRDWLAGAVPCYGVYKTKNGHLAVGALEPKFWEPFVTAIGAPELCAGALHTGEDGERVRAALARVLEAHTTGQAAFEKGGQQQSEPSCVRFRFRFRFRVGFVLLWTL